MHARSEPTFKPDVMKQVRELPANDSSRYGRLQDYAFALGLVALTTGLGFLLQSLLPHASLLLLFLTSVLLISSRTGLGPALFASLLSFLAINYFFTQPFLTLRVDDDGDVTTLIFFLIIATITGNLAARMHREIAERKASLQRISELYEFSSRMSSASTSQAVLQELADHIAKSLDSSVRILPAIDRASAEILVPVSIHSLPAGQNLAEAGPEISNSNGFLPELVRVLQTTPAVQWWNNWNIFRLNPTQQELGFVLVYGKKLHQERMLEVRNLCDQATIALDRTELVAEIEKERINIETEQLRSALLASVSHDLRTPLAAIIGSTSSLLDLQDTLKAEDSRELLATIDQEARRLDSYVQNLLDMTRLGHGGLKLKRDWVDLHDIVSSATSRLGDRLGRQQLENDISPGFPLLWLHGALVEQAFFNLLDNAIRHSPEPGHIRILARSDQGNAVVDICDEGPGVPEHEREKIFDMFHTAAQGDRSGRQGTGLGLAICRGMIGAHGGSVVAMDGLNGKGTCMRVTLPFHPGQDG
jgi:two-component system sensor histidine kinase KdpD